MQKKAIKKAQKKPIDEAKPAAKHKYLFAVGRRKTAVARIKLFPQGTGTLTVNKQALEKYFPTLQLQKDAAKALDAAGFLKSVDVEAQAAGGGVRAQAEAVRLGIARALVKMDGTIKTVLKKHGLMTRDAREKERKKPGLKRARRAPQWQKR